MADDCDCCNSTDPCDQVNCTFFDGQMLAISQTKITSRANGSTAVNTFNCTGAQSTSRGNDPPSFEVTTTLDSDVGQNCDLLAVNMTTNTWQPASQGAITKLRFCIDMFIDNASYYTTKGGGGTTDPNITCWFVIRQNSKVYGCRIAAMRNRAIWQRQFKDNLVATDFEEFYSGERPAAAGITNTSSHPDFTTSGPAITFGWAVQPDGANNRAVGVDSQTDSYWDNLCVQVTHDIPCPTAPAALIDIPSGVSTISQPLVCGTIPVQQLYTQDCLDAATQGAVSLNRVFSGASAVFVGSVVTGLQSHSRIKYGASPGPGVAFSERQYEIVNYQVYTVNGSCEAIVYITVYVAAVPEREYCVNLNMYPQAGSPSVFRVQGYFGGQPDGYPCSGATLTKMIAGTYPTATGCTLPFECNITSADPSVFTAGNGMLTVDAAPYQTGAIIGSIYHDADLTAFEAERSTNAALATTISAAGHVWTKYKIFEANLIYRGTYDTNGVCLANLTAQYVSYGGSNYTTYIFAPLSTVKISLKP